MLDYTRSLGDAVKCTRGKLGLTQSEVAERADIDVRTLINIENYKGNPKFEVLYPLIRAMNIDPRDIFYPERLRDTPALNQLRLLIEECSEEDAEALIPVMDAVLSILHTQKATSV